MEILSYVPGRIRLKEKKLYKNKEVSQLIEFYLNDLPGVKKCGINPVIGTIIVLYDIKEIDIETLKEKIKKLVYTELQYLNYIKEYYKELIEQEKKLKQAKDKMLVFGGLYIIYKIKQFFFGKFYLSRSLPILTIASIITIIKGYPIVRKIYNKIGEYFPENPDKLLLLLGTFFTLIREGNKGIMLLFLKSFTDALQVYTELECKKMIIKNNQSLGKLVWYCHNNKEYLIPLRALKPSDVVIFNSKEFIPLEGTIIDGNGFVDYVYYTGQSEIRQVNKNHKVFPGIKVISGNIKIRIDKIPYIKPKPDLESKQLEIVRKVNDYQHKSLYVALLMATGSYFITGSFLSPLSVMLVMSPAAAKVAYNAGMSNTLKLLLKHKIILRNINTIENIVNANSIVFDKTGTLTKNRMRILNIEVFNKQYTEDRILEICAACETGIYHPVANTLSIQGKKSVNINDEVIYIPSRGVISSYNGHKVIIGNKKLMEEEGIDIVKNNERSFKKTCLPVYVAVNGKMVGKINLVEDMESSIKNVIKQLRTMGINDISIISGDLTSNVKTVADNLNIEDYHGELTIIDKDRFVRSKKNKGPVIMIGDGINDTYAMRSANVSVSYNEESSEQAVLQSDCILAEKEIRLIKDLLELSRKSYSRIERNIIFSQNYNIVFGILSMLGYIDPFKAKSFNTLNSIISVANSMTIYRIK